MSRPLAPAAAALVLVAVLASCGGSGGGHGNGMMGGQSGMMNGGQTTMPARSPMAPTPTATTPGGTVAGNGRQLFLASGCGGCHILAAAGTTGTAGPDLDQARPSYQRVIEQVTQGGVGMPSFAGSLTRSQIRALARYVVNSTR